tara:strand:+ start:105 stop:539 length:435 start_codon:yes stop_codon:yes gene_type:complete
MAKEIEAFTDGACLGNPGHGGWAFLFFIDGKKIILSGGEKNTTNNRMELTAIINCIQNVPTNYSININTDSKYVINGASSWLKKWRLNEWTGSSNKKIKNIDLWKKLDLLLDSTDVKWNWIRGHSGNKFNEEVDRLARSQAYKL